jgi:arylsulfatase
MSDNGGNGESGPNGRLEGNPPGSPDSNVYLGMNWATLNNTPFRRYKHFTHEGGISTPLIAHWPAHIPKRLENTFNHTPGHLIDVMPTVLEAAATQPLPGKTPPEGISLAPAFTGRKLERSQPLFFMHEGNRAVRQGKWKLVSKYMDEWELYDMDADRTEMRNLASANPAKVKELAAAYDAWALRTDTDPWTGPRRTDWGQERKQ